MVALIPRNLYYMGDTEKTLRGLPGPVKDLFNAALDDAKHGETHPNVKAYHGYSGITVQEVVKRHMGNTYRALYTARLVHAVYVLDIFQKKSKESRETPKEDKERLDGRFKMAKQRDEELERAEARNRLHEEQRERLR